MMFILYLKILEMGFYGVIGNKLILLYIDKFFIFIYWDKYIERYIDKYRDKFLIFYVLLK